MADLEKLYRDRMGANFVLPPSSNHVHGKVLVILSIHSHGSLYQCMFMIVCSIYELPDFISDIYNIGSQGSAFCGAI